VADLGSRIAFSFTRAKAKSLAGCLGRHAPATQAQALDFTTNAANVIVSGALTQNRSLISLDGSRMNYGILARSPRGVGWHFSPEVLSWQALMEFSQLSEHFERRPG